MVGNEIPAGADPVWQPKDYPLAEPLAPPQLINKCLDRLEEPQLEFGLIDEFEALVGYWRAIMCLYERRSG